MTARRLTPLSLMVLAPIPWAGRVWALPFLTALVPSERACRERGRRHKPLLNVGGQLALTVLSEALKDKSPKVRIRAVEALAFGN